MSMHFRKTLTAFTALLLVTFASADTVFAGTEERRSNIKAENIVIDFILVRPVGIAGSAILTSVFVLSLPFSLLGGNTGTVFEKLVSEPAKFAFTRPLGDFKQY